jgi:hypothetical protein
MIYPLAQIFGIKHLLVDGCQFCSNKRDLMKRMNTVSNVTLCTVMKLFCSAKGISV